MSVIINHGYFLANDYNRYSGYSKTAINNLLIILYGYCGFMHQHLYVAGTISIFCRFRDQFNKIRMLDLRIG